VIRHGRKKVSHAIYRVVGFKIVKPLTLLVKFDDGCEREIDFRPVLAGEIYGALLDEKLFNQVEIDPESHTLVWPNGADFDPETLHEWPVYDEEMKRMARQWEATRAKTG
jgi:hypothetical protein